MKELNALLREQIRWVHSVIFTNDIYFIIEVFIREDLLVMADADVLPGQQALTEVMQAYVFLRNRYSSTPL